MCECAKTFTNMEYVRFLVEIMKFLQYQKSAIFIWFKILKNEPSKISGKQSLKKAILHKFNWSILYTLTHLIVRKRHRRIQNPVKHQRWSILRV